MSVAVFGTDFLGSLARPTDFVSFKNRYPKKQQKHRSLKLPRVVYFGDASYSIYIWHWLLLTVLTVLPSSFYGFRLLPTRVLPFDRIHVRAALIHFNFLNLFNIVR